MTPARLAHMQRINERFMQDRCELRNTANPRAVIATGVACNVSTFSPQPQITGDERGEVTVSWRISLPAFTDVAPEWLIVLADDTRTVSLRGRIFAVVGDLPISDEMARDVIAVESQ